MASANLEIRVQADTQELTRVAAQQVVDCANKAIRANGVFTLALSGGSTPRSLYTLLASHPFRDQVAWDKVKFFWGDERHVPPDHQDSNYKMAHEAMLSHLPIPPDHIHRMLGEMSSPQEAADWYESVLREQFQSPPPEIPHFNLVLLGMGPDGHTASLFPGTPAVHETSRLVSAPWVEKFQTHRITLTPSILNQAEQVVFLVSGGDKAETLREVLEGPYEPDRFPSQVIRPTQGKLTWLVDQAAARELRRRP